MAQPIESSFSAPALGSFLSAQPRRVVQPRHEVAPEKLSAKRSMVAGAFLVAYLAVYLAVGFVAVSAIQHLWVALAQ